jgi:hypothetical protein
VLQKGRPLFLAGIAATAVTIMRNFYGQLVTATKARR